MTPAYLQTPDVEWEQNETSTVTGKVARKRYKVPEYIEKGTIVCHEGRGQRGDQIFFGDPTPDMIPVDDEARAISAGFEQHWSYKPDTAEISYSQSLVDDLQAKRAEMESRPQQVEIAGLGDLVATIATMAKQNQDLIASLSHRKL